MAIDELELRNTFLKEYLKQQIEEEIPIQKEEDEYETNYYFDFGNTTVEVYKREFDQLFEEYKKLADNKVNLATSNDQEYCIFCGASHGDCPHTYVSGKE